MRQSIVVCDRCGLRDLSHKKGTAVSFDIRILREKACQEDDGHYIDTLDLCCRCASTEMSALFKKLPSEEKGNLLAAIRSQRPRFPEEMQ